MGGRWIDISVSWGKQVKEPNLDAIPEDCKTIFVRGLPYDFSEDQIGDHFQICGKIRQVRKILNSVTKLFKGFAYIEFQENSSVKKALK